MLEEITILLGEGIPEDPHSMQKHAIDIDAYRHRLVVMLATERNTLTEEEGRYQLPKTKNLTEHDRKQYASLKTKDQKTKVEILEGTIVCIDKRITLIQSMLRLAIEDLKRNG